MGVVCLARLVISSASLFQRRLCSNWTRSAFKTTFFGNVSVKRHLYLFLFI